MAIITKIYYLERLNLYETEKPYMLAFIPPGIVIPESNHSYVSCEVPVSDAQPRKCEFSLDVHGFQFNEWASDLVAEDFDDDETVKSKYYPEIVKHMWHEFPDSSHIHILTHLRRKRGANFLVSSEEDPRFPNPILYAHTDFTPRGGAIAIAPILEKNEQLRGLRYELINVWRPTRGPNRDWPLGLCDYRTIAPEDIEFNDVVHEDHVGESMRLYANPNHQWHFLDCQTISQVALFRNTHCDGLEKPFGAHLSFYNPNTREDSGDFPRESIEIRLVRFFK